MPSKIRNLAFIWILLNNEVHLPKSSWQSLLLLLVFIIVVGGVVVIGVGSFLLSS